MSSSESARERTCRFRHIKPDAVAPPFGRYVHGVCLPTGMRLLFSSGQLGISKDGFIPPSVEDQAALCFQNIASILDAEGMAAADIVKLSAFVTTRDDMPKYMRARDRFLNEIDPPPASTLMIVSGFTRAEFLVEIEVIAASQAPHTQ